MLNPIQSCATRKPNNLTIQCGNSVFVPAHILRANIAFSFVLLEIMHNFVISNVSVVPPNALAETCWWLLQERFTIWSASRRPNVSANDQIPYWKMSGWFRMHPQRPVFYVCLNLGLENWAAACHVTSAPLDCHSTFNWCYVTKKHAVFICSYGSLDSSQ